MPIRVALERSQRRQRGQGHDELAEQPRRAARDARIEAGSRLARGKIVEARDATRLMEAVIRPGDRVCLEGDNQKQADLLSQRAAGGRPRQGAMICTWCSRASCCRNISTCSIAASRSGWTIAYSGPQSARIARMLFGGKIELGAVHTYLELFARYFIDLTPHVALIAAVSADRDGNLYTGPNTEDTPTVVEATAFKDGVVIAQVNEIVDKVPRVDIPGGSRPFHRQGGQAVLRRAAVHARSGRDHRRRRS